MKKALLNLRNNLKNIPSQFKKLNKKVVLLCSIFVLSTTGLIVYLLLPKLPEFVEPLEDKIITKVSYPIPPEMAEALGVEVIGDDESRKPPQSGRLVIPSIGVDAEILECSTLDILDKYEGVWREPNSGNPMLSESNMVIAGHRFQYLPPNRTTFYYLDRIKNGEKILVYWDGSPKLFEVTSVQTISPYNSTVRAIQPGANILTIYTCHPIGSDAERIVVQAKMI